MFDRRSIMIAAWVRYRAAYGKSKFRQSAFREALRIEWSIAKRAVRLAAEGAVRQAQALERFNAPAVVVVPVMTEMERRIDALKYMPFRYDFASAERAIRAEYAA